MSTRSQMVGKAIDRVQDALEDAALWLPLSLQNLSRPNYAPLAASDVFVSRFPVSTNDPAEAAQVFAYQADRLAPAPIETLSWAVARVDDSFWAAAMAENDTLEALRPDAAGQSGSVAGYQYAAPTGEHFVIRTAADKQYRRARFLARLGALSLLIAGALILAASLQSLAERGFAQARVERQALLVELREHSDRVNRGAALAQLGEIDLAQTIALIDAISASLPETTAVNAFQLTGRELELTWRSSSTRQPTALLTLLEGVAVPDSLSMQATASAETGDQVQLNMTLQGAEP